MLPTIKSRVHDIIRHAIALALLVTVFSAPTRAQSGVYAYFNDDPVTLLGSLSADFTTYVMSNPSISGITVVISWQKYDVGTVTSGPVLNINVTAPTLRTLDADMASIAGSSKKINLIVWAGTASGPGGANSSTPAYIFDTAWPMNCVSLTICSTTVGAVDTCDCHNYHGSKWPTPLGSKCANANSTAFDGGGVPAAWEQPFYLAYENWLGKLLSYYNANNTSGSNIRTQIGYIRIGVGTGGGSVVACPSVEKGIFMGGNTAPNPPLDETVWRNYNNSVYASVAQSSPTPTMILEASPFGGLTLGMSDGNTPLSWADDVAQVAIANGLGIGAESLNGTSDQGDPLLYSQIQPCSNDWCGLFNSYYSISPMRSLQTITPTNPNCLNQPTSCNGTGSLVTVLPFGTQRRATTFEIYYNDLLCAYDSDNYADSTYCPLISPGVYLAPFLPYQQALANAALLQPNSTADAQGKTSLSGSSSIH
jgi:hypothetical protein